MDLDEIRTFVTIARERSFSGAAGTLGRSQPAISRRIELLERDLAKSGAAFVKTHHSSPDGFHELALFQRQENRACLTVASTPN